MAMKKQILKPMLQTVQQQKQCTFYLLIIQIKKGNQRKCPLRYIMTHFHVSVSFNMADNTLTMSHNSAAMSVVGV